jgi:uncharacterized protein involved in exopolysaccharide biosynthesis
MSRPFRVVAQRVVDAAWRRRYLLIVPIIIMIPLSIVGAKLLPNTYTARSLMLIKEAAKTNPLYRGVDSPSPQRAQERVAGLRAVLGSEYVLSKALRDLGEKNEPDPKKRAEKIDELRASLKLDLIGGDFLEFRMSGPNAAGLGRRLHLVTARFLEALSPETGVSAGEYLVQNRLKELEAVEQARSLLSERLASLLPNGLETGLKELEDLNRRLHEASQRLSSAAARSGGLHMQVTSSEPRNPSTQQSVAEVINEGSQAVRNDSTVDPNGSTASRAPLGVALKNYAYNEVSTILQDEIKKLRSARTHLADAIAEYRRVEEEIPASDKAIHLARELHDLYKKQFEDSEAKRDWSILDASERIFVIDPPKDPDFPSVPRIYFALFGVLASCALGVGLATVAELMDQTVRYPEDLAAQTGLPIIAVVADLKLHKRSSGDATTRRG